MSFVVCLFKFDRDGKSSGGLERGALPVETVVFWERIELMIRLIYYLSLIVGRSYNFDPIMLDRSHMSIPIPPLGGAEPQFTDTRVRFHWFRYAPMPFYFLQGFWIGVQITCPRRIYHIKSFREHDFAQ